MADKAVLAGINNYLHISDLRGCLNDVANMRALLTQVMGFPHGNIHILQDQDVTKDKVLAEWKWLLRDAAPGDRLVFHMSSHGSYTTDLDNDEADGVDELICLYDMDWNNPESYLLDDDIRRMTVDIPPGVFVTFVFDLCHSGTGTRMLLSPETSRGLTNEKPPLVDLRASLSRMQDRPAGRDRSLASVADTADRILAPTSPQEMRDSVLVRFVEPPADVLATLRSRGVRSTLREVVEERVRDDKMNHVLLAGSEATQTCADAFLDGSYQGAFTCALCRAVTAGGAQIDLQSVIRTVRQRLVQEGFGQNPQLEPVAAGGPIFGSSARPTEGHSGGASMSDPQLGATLTEMTALMRDIRTLLSNQGQTGRDRASDRRAIVFVHGICRHKADYADPWWAALRTHLIPQVRDALERNRHAVLWSDLVSPERVVARSAAEQEQHDELAATLRDVLVDRAQQELLASVPRQAREAVPVATRLPRDRALLGIPGIDCIDDFVKYLLNSATRDAVQRRVTDVVAPLLQQGFQIEMVTHSWGTVVAFEALHTLNNVSATGSIHNWFTVGSALSIVPVQSEVRPSSGARPPHVLSWTNLDAYGDIVGGALEPVFAIDQEFLQLDPTNCPSIFQLVTPSCAHSSYFDAANLAVNRDIFARFING